jgi:hypothetical protein
MLLYNQLLAYSGTVFYRTKTFHLRLCNPFSTDVETLALNLKVGSVNRRTHLEIQLLENWSAEFNNVKTNEAR